jgi:hypothetical protein
MKTSNLFRLAFAAALTVLAHANSARADKEAKSEAKTEAGTLTVVDNAGKEHTLKTWKFIVGTRRLTWLAPTAAKKKYDETDKPNDAKKPLAPRLPAGPEALVLREENSTDLKDGIFTYIPLDRIKSIDYDNEKRTVAVSVGMPDDKQANAEIVLIGSTKYVGENKLTIEAEADLGELGVAAVKFQGGTAKGIKTIRFPPPRVKNGSATRLAEITIADKNNDVHKVSDVAPLYKLGDGERLLPVLLFKKTVKIDLAKIQKLTLSENGGLEFDVALKDGKNLILTLLDKVSPVDGKPAQLLGFVAKVAAGYKVYPLKASPNNAFTIIRFDPDNVDAKKKDDAKKEPKE